MQPSSHAYLGRFFSALLCSAIAFNIQLTVAQEDVGHILRGDALEYYLMQAFHVARAEQRIALNHIGIETQAVEGGYLVTAALEGYPAHQAGIERGSKLLRVDGEPFHPVYSFNSRAADSDGFTAEPGPLRLELEAMGAVETVEISPVFENLYDSYRSATLNSLQEFSLGNKTIGYVRLWGLSRTTSDLFTLEQQMQEFAGSDGLIVDLRNAYGFLSSKHLDLFVRDGRGNFDAAGPSNRHVAIEPKFPIATARPFTKPIVVLVNSQTRAGAELLAYGLSKLGRITTLGENSAGRIGSYMISGDALIYSPSDETLIDGRRFEAIGIIPKEPVPFPFTQSGRSDPQFEFSIDILLGII